MSYAKWKNQNQSIATATVATVATIEQKNGLEDDEKLLTVAVAASENQKKSEPLPQIEPLSKIPVFGGGDSVILANSTNQQEANKPHPKGEIKPVLQVAAQSEPLKEGADLNYSLENQVKNESHSQTVDGQKKPLAYPQIEDGQLNRKSEEASPKFYGDVFKTERPPQIEEVKTDERKIPFNLDNYRHLVTCNQCEHLSLTGSCSRLGKRVNPQALRECDSFTLLKKERSPLEEVKPYTQDELNRLLNQAAKPLYHHLIDCEQCSLEDARYCVEGFCLGSTFDCLLLCFDDAADKRYKLMNQVIKARVSRRRAFVGLNSDNAPLPMQTSPITRKCGNTPQDEAFINHWTACKVCKPNLDRYCSEGQRLEKEANC